MGWAYGWEDGREIGYGVIAECDFPGCTAVIDRGLGCRCGGAQSLADRSFSCGRYFCADHLYVEHEDCPGCWTEIG